MDPGPFLRGVAFAGTPKVPYPRANPDDVFRLPIDTWSMAQIPAGVRLEFTGDAAEIELAYETRTDDLGFRETAAQRSFQLWRGNAMVAEDKAVIGPGTVRLSCGSASSDKAIVYLPEPMKPRVVSIEAIGGVIDPAPPHPRWVCYGDSIAEGWLASAPALSWTATVAREHGLDCINMGYNGAGRGEVVSAEHVAALPAAVISISHGTNCWTRIPYSVGMFREGLMAFLTIVRQAHALTPIVVISPLIRPEGEASPNKLGASLADLRMVMEDVVGERIASGDAHLALVPGLGLVTGNHLVDGLHPSDEGHRVLASALGPILAKAVA